MEFSNQQDVDEVKDTKVPRGANGRNPVYQGFTHKFGFQSLLSLKRNAEQPHETESNNQRKISGTSMDESISSVDSSEVDSDERKKRLEELKLTLIANDKRRNSVKSIMSSDVGSDIGVDDYDDDYYDTNDESDNDREDVSFKVLVVGNASCGKTSFIRRYTEGTFAAHYNSTIGVDYKEHEYQYDDDFNARIRLWDIAGQDRFAKMTRPFFKGATGAVIVWDVTRESTFDAVINWKREIDSCLPDKNIPVVLLANKIDCLDDYDDIVNVGRKMERCELQHGFLKCFIGSAKKGENVEKSMACLVDKMMESYLQEKTAQVNEEDPTDSDVGINTPTDRFRLSDVPRHKSHSRRYSDGGPATFESNCACN